MSASANATTRCTRVRVAIAHILNPPPDPSGCASFDQLINNILGVSTATLKYATRAAHSIARACATDSAEYKLLQEVHDQNLNSLSLPFLPSVRCFFRATSFATLSHSSRLLLPWTPALPREPASYRLRSWSSDRLPSSDSSMEISTPLAFRWKTSSVTRTRCWREGDGPWSRVLRPGPAETFQRQQRHRIHARCP